MVEVEGVQPVAYIKTRLCLRNTTASVQLSSKIHIKDIIKSYDKFFAEKGTRIIGPTIPIEMRAYKYTEHLENRS